MIKPDLGGLKRGQEVWAVIDNPLENGDAVISVNGERIRVENLSGKKLRPGQRVLLRVEAIEPLQFKLVGTHGISRKPGQFDVTI